MKIINTGDSTLKPSVVMLVYGQGGIGKTTFTSTAPKPILADCENGSKYFGLRGIKMDVAHITQWNDIREFYKYVRESDHETVIIDPIGELMEKLKTEIANSQNKKWVQFDGALTMAGWGEMKERLRQFIKLLRDSGKHVIFVAHVEEKSDEDKVIKRPKVMTKISEEIIALVDIVGFMEMVKQVTEEGVTIEKRIIRVSPSDKYESKDRTGQLGGVIEPNFQKIINACQGNEVYAWSSDLAKEAQKPKVGPPAPAPAPEPKPEPVTEITDERVANLKKKMATKKTLPKTESVTPTTE